MADSNRPRPRPRPKPKAKAAPAVDTKTPGPSSSTTSSPLKTVQIRDDDEMFMRNRGRTSKMWEKLEKMNQETKVIHVESDSDDEEGTPKRRKQKRKAKTPPWQGNKALDRLLSVDLSDDSDDEVEITGSATTPRGKQLANRKRQRTRSRSITPPPALPIQQVQHARALVQQALNTAPRPASPTQRDDDYDSDTPIFLNPELARIAEAEAARASSQAPAASSPPPTDNNDTVQLSVKWQPHPLNEAGKEEVWVFKMNRDDNFRDLFEATAEEASILSESLIMSYKGKRIFSSVTPMTLQIWTAEAELVACEKVTYEYLRKNPLAASYSAFDHMTPAPDVPSDTDEPPNTQDESGAESDADGDTFTLILRSAIAKDITLTVRPTTKCGAIVRAFLKKAGVADKYPEGGAKRKGAKDPRLSVDGDKMGNDVEIGDADLEDGDLVEVVGL
ncbi:hypothetical protein Hypma_014343 [Hypsizygus marmoreus]|uniref:Rad60/SUMO-like domain-containing protein n=1 Tax=Hypsizygus marmoreus TaxID=39966 RepID=A0A369JF81_HYPMA|nr:hypothetical protein Hypma_014343 [Hypsizygus marmoreus]